MSQEQKKPRGFSNPKNTETTSNITSTTIEVDAKSILNKLDASVKVIHGANDGEFQLAGQKVSAVRASLVDAFNIPGDALAFVNGEQVEGNYVLVASNTLEFVKAAGTKGNFKPLWHKDLR